MEETMHVYRDDYPGTPADVRQVGETEEQYRERMARRAVETQPGNVM